MTHMSPRSPTPEQPLDRDPPRDAALGSALRRADIVASDVDALHLAIVAAAHERLESIDRTDTWWDWTARWGRAAIPIACAAALAGIAATTLLTLPADEPTVVRAPGVAFATVASPAITGTQLMDSLVGPATHDWLLNGAVSR